jgi:hypothetical protein
MHWSVCTVLLQYVDWFAVSVLRSVYCCLQILGQDIYELLPGVMCYQSVTGFQGYQVSFMLSFGYIEPHQPTWVDSKQCSYVNEI